jgi:hypothetical protein
MISSPERKMVVSQPIYERKNEFDPAFAPPIVAILVFSFALLRWGVENRQSSLNEIFARKKEINSLLMAKDNLTKFIEGAVDKENLVKLTWSELATNKKSVVTSKTLKVGPFTLRTSGYEIASPKISEILSEITKLDYLKDTPAFDQEQKIFVFMEIDNLEFALEKYNAGYLDNEQMFRVCEIFESRCLSRPFRYLAATQGLAYYRFGLRQILARLIVRGHVLTVE